MRFDVTSAASPWKRRRGWHYAAAFAIAAAGCLVRMLLFPLLGPDTPILLSIVAVSVSAWFFGFGPGVMATVVSFLGAVWMLLPGLGHSSLLTLAQFLRLALFVFTGLMVSGLTEAWYRSIAARQRSEQDQENRILQERNRIAREIHDTLAQGLTGIIIQLEAAQDALESAPQECAARLTCAGDLARQSLSEARRSVHALRPEMLDSQNLATALRNYAEQMTTGSGVSATVDVIGTPPSFIAPEVELNLMRIGTEALTNALRHARANLVAIVLEYGSSHISLSVRDNGRGFSMHSTQARSGFGLTGMWERAERIGAQFHLESSPGHGTEVRVVVQFDPARYAG